MLESTTLNIFFSDESWADKQSSHLVALVIEPYTSERIAGGIAFSGSTGIVVQETDIRTVTVKIPYIRKRI
ncbi:hypothetical protein [Desulfobacter latus]|uniref:Uncharacterized protein n=1 Tax=Desulfobacter latus TaxID=2292 RepID=A0A850T1F8_9BACT|nr:hypothetical protein [Desulfobacter latus]NWH06180.1 hypothetical protein [Desulfobacter latus]